MTSDGRSLALYRPGAAASRRRNTLYPSATYPVATRQRGILRITQPDDSAQRVTFAHICSRPCAPAEAAVPLPKDAPLAEG